MQLRTELSHTGRGGLDFGYAVDIPRFLRLEAAAPRMVELRFGDCYIECSD